MLGQTFLHKRGPNVPWTGLPHNDDHTQNVTQFTGIAAVCKFRAPVVDLTHRYLIRMPLPYGREINHGELLHLATIRRCLLSTDAQVRSQLDSLPQDVDERAFLFYVAGFAFSVDVERNLAMFSTTTKACLINAAHSQIQVTPDPQSSSLKALSLSLPTPRSPQMSHEWTERARKFIIDTTTMFESNQIGCIWACLRAGFTDVAIKLINSTRNARAHIEPYFLALIAQTPRETVKAIWRHVIGPQVIKTSYGIMTSIGAHGDPELFLWACNQLGCTPRSVMQPSSNFVMSALVNTQLDFIIWLWRQLRLSTDVFVNPRGLTWPNIGFETFCTNADFNNIKQFITEFCLDPTATLTYGPDGGVIGTLLTNRRVVTSKENVAWIFHHFSPSYFCICQPDVITALKESPDATLNEIATWFDSR